MGLNITDRDKVHQRLIRYRCATPDEREFLLNVGPMRRPAFKPGIVTRLARWRVLEKNGRRSRQRGADDSSEFVGVTTRKGNAYTYTSSRAGPGPAAPRSAPGPRAPFLASGRAAEFRHYFGVVVKLRRTRAIANDVALDLSESTNSEFLILDSRMLMFRYSNASPCPEGRGTLCAHAAVACKYLKLLLERADSSRRSTTRTRPP